MQKTNTRDRYKQQVQRVDTINRCQQHPAYYTNTRCKQQIQTTDTNNKYNDRYERYIQARGNYKQQAQLQIRTMSTAADNKKQIQTKDTRNKYKHHIQTTDSNDRYKHQKPRKQTSTSARVVLVQKSSQNTRNGLRWDFTGPKFDIYSQKFNARLFWFE